MAVGGYLTVCTGSANEKMYSTMITAIASFHMRSYFFIAITSSPTQKSVGSDITAQYVTVKDSTSFSRVFARLFYFITVFDKLQEIFAKICLCLG